MQCAESDTLFRSAPVRDMEGAILLFSLVPVVSVLGERRSVGALSVPLSECPNECDHVLGLSPTTSGLNEGLLLRFPFASPVLTP